MTPPPRLAPEARTRLEEVFGKIAEFEARVSRACPGGITCGPGCDRCCQGGLALRAVEAAYLLEGVRALSPRDRTAVSGALADPSGGRCPLLEAGRCLAYRHRPALCRTHGLPMLRAEEDTVLVHHCPRNLRGVDARVLPPSLLLDEARLSLLLDAVEALYARESGWPGGRVPISELLRAGL